MNVKEEILKRINTSALQPSGKTPRTIGELASDVLNASQMSSKSLSEKCLLSVATVERLRKYDKPYNPQTRSVERVLSAFEISLRAL